ncbi:F-box domain-containing protein [Mycena indigotica]|uniref:F-box domain-containing protein n=1 Tax=Mycena indigotica TaxID=2126181 RepID=A0A8H6T2S9_9AGAR|nr:F-box domain-containing protein [Mycena indigotica]KAF7309322.1 F-box domain-containing protein [Mycena indigotica]
MSDFTGKASTLTWSFDVSPFLASLSAREPLSFHASTLGDSTLRRAVNEVPDEIMRYKAGIQQLEALTTRLSAQQRQLTRYLEDCQSALKCHIRQLPAELLVDILELAAGLLGPGEFGRSDLDTEKSELERLGQKSLLRLAQVSSHWRLIVMETPRLWANIRVDCDLWPDIDKSTNVFLPLLASTLSKSANHPLTIAFLGPDSDDESSQSVMVRALSLIAHHAFRWEDVFIKIDSLSLLLELPFESPPVFHQLTTVEFSLSLPNDEKTFALLQHSPRLSNVTFTGDVPDVILPWEHIRAFAMFYRYDSDWRALKSLTNATMASLRELGPDSSFYIDMCLAQLATGTDPDLPVACSPRSPQTPVLSNITSLTLSICQEQSDNVELSDWFNAFTCTAMWKFRLVPQQDPDPHQFPVWAPAAFASFAVRSRFEDTLTSLAIIAVVTTAELLSALELLPKLEQLLVSDLPAQTGLPAVITNALLLALAQRDAVLIPELRSITLSSWLDFADDTLVEFIKERGADIFRRPPPPTSRPPPRHLAPSPPTSVTLPRQSHQWVGGGLGGEVHDLT